MTRLLRFFVISKVHPPHILILAAACFGIGLWTIEYDAGELDSALGLVLVAQMFLASTGFTSRAFAGHFDPVLVAGSARTDVAAAHWLASIAPGVMAWLALSLTGLLVHSSAAVSALAGRRLLALLIVSNIAWVAGYRLSRGAAGVLWLTVLVGILLQHNLRALSASIDQGAHTWLLDVPVVFVCPFLLIGDRPYVPPVVLAIAAVLAFTAVGLVALATRRLDVLLMERG